MMQTTYGLAHLWSQSDALIRAVTLLLLGLSVASWGIMASKALRLLRLRALARWIEGDFWRQADLAAAGRALGERDPAGPFAALVHEGLAAAEHHREAESRLAGAVSRDEWLARALRGALDESVAGLQRGLPLLASVSSTTPFIGLFGTVWGIYHALIAIGSSGQAGIEQVAGPVGEALLMTALGLAVAIPATLGYNALVRQNKALVQRLNRFAQDVHACLLTGRRTARALRVVAGGS